MAALTAGSILFFSWIGLISASENHNQSSGECQHHSGIHLASWNYCGVGQYGKYILNNFTWRSSSSCFKCRTTRTKSKDDITR